MKRDDFINTFLEGSSRVPKEDLVLELIGKVFDERSTVAKFVETIDFMNDVARDSGWSMNCRSCGKSYQPDCELSEMFGSENYCGGSQWCTP